MAAINGLPNHSATANAAVKDSQIQGVGSSGGFLNTTKDVKGGSTEAEFGDVWKSMQAQYGEKHAKPRTVKKQMDKDDFLKIMVTQMKNQDPMSPMKADQFATQLAQFTSVEQLQNLNQKMGQMTKANQPLERLAMTNLIGKIVTVDRNRVVHSENEMSTLNYEMPANAKEAKLSILNEAGEKIATRDLGPSKKGTHDYQWDGKKDDGMAASSGNYVFRVEAVDGAGKSIPIQGSKQLPVVGISFDGGEGTLLVGDVKNPTKTSMRNITRIDTMVRDMGPKVGSIGPTAGLTMPGGEVGMEAAAMGGMNPSINPSANSELDPLAANGVPAELQEKIRQSLAGSMGGSPAAAVSTGMNGSVLPSDPSTGTNYIKNIENKSGEGFPNGISSGDNG